jgi:hypothetical protein
MYVIAISLVCFEEEERRTMTTTTTTSNACVMGLCSDRSTWLGV